MAKVAPLRGLLFSPSRVPDLGPVVAPPYDVIPADRADELRARHPHNIVHLDLPAGDAPARYGQAASLLAQWRREGVLERDPADALYVTSQRYAVRGMPEKVRWGFIGLLRIEDDSARVVLPHETTMDAPRRDRLELTAAAAAQLSPIFVLFTDPQGSLSGHIESAAQRPADRWVSDDAGVETRLWRLTDPEAIAALCGGLADHRIWIADGHHRYAAMRELRDRRRAAHPGVKGQGPHDFVLAYFSNIDAPGLTILPYHRVLKGPRGFDADDLARRASAHFDVKRFSFEGYDHRAEQIRRRLREVSDRGRLAVAVYGGAAGFLLLLLKTEGEADALLKDLPAALRGLDVSVLHRGILQEALGITPDQIRMQGCLRYTEEVEKAINWVDAGEGQAAFVLNAPRREVMMSVAQEGLQMPQKSTYFYPKVLTGLVIHPLDAGPETVPDAQPEPAGSAAPADAAG